MRVHRSPGLAAPVSGPGGMRYMFVTPERFVALRGATCIARDEYGKLWRRSWRLDAWAAVEVTNGTPEPDGTFKKYFLQVPAHFQTPRQAVAWTYGLLPEQYSLRQRT